MSNHEEKLKKFSFLIKNASKNDFDNNVGQIFNQPSNVISSKRGRKEKVGKVKKISEIMR